MPSSFQSLSNLSPSDQSLFSRYGRGPTMPLAHQTITDAFEVVAAAYPYATAVRKCFGTERVITYAELDWRSNVIANLLLQTYRMGSGQRVGCVYSRCLEMCAFILGVLKTVVQYVPADDSVIIQENLRHIIWDTGARLVLCLSNFQEKVERSVPLDRLVEILPLDAVDLIWRTGDTRQTTVDIKSGDGAYVIYTSGTTGTPKGVDSTHEGVCNTLLNEPGKLGITIGTNVACVLTLGFEMCVWEILDTLLNGGTVQLRGSGSGRGGDRDEWNACLERTDTVISTPSGAQGYFPRRANFPNIKTIAVAGELCPIALAEEWARHVRFVNACGPTEISIVTSTNTPMPGQPLTVGRPLPNTTVYILDEAQNPVRIGDVGVMWVGGLGVSRGYVNLDKLTAERYVLDKFTRDGRLMFNTGDLCQWDANGELVLLGRVDDQVKIKGCRVELDGVIVIMELFAGVEKACALKVGEKPWGLYTTHGSVVMDEVSFQKHLERRLATHAIPARFVHVPRMPLTPGGKVDKEALRVLAQKKVEAPGAPPPVHMSENTQPRVVVTQTIASSSIGSISTCSSGDLGSEATFGKEELTLPPKNGFHGQRWLRHKGLSVYRKLFILIFAVNLVALIVIATDSKCHGGLPLERLTTAVAANLFVSVAFRLEHIVNVVFWLAMRLPTSTPLAIRRHFARCYHMGGIHTGCAVMASVWWLLFASQSTVYFVHGSRRYPVHEATIGLTMAILLLLCVMLAMSHPAVRTKLHNQFEWTHRFAGWTALALVWAHVAVSTASLKAPDIRLGDALQANPALWLLSLTTLSVALPWMRLRPVNVVVEPLSDHAVRLYFDYCTPPPGHFVRVSDAPLREWHPFATITVPGAAGFSIIVSRAGDWTSMIIENPPKRLWTRGVPTAGVLHVAPLFRRIVLVATGSGIAPCLPVILAQKVPCRVFWSTPNPLATFGTRIVDSVLATDPQAVIWNTRERGRPNLALEAYRLYKSSGAECVICISNKLVTTKLVFDLETRGVPTFGPIWDS